MQSEHGEVFHDKDYKHDDDHIHDEHNHNHDSVWFGLMALLGIIGFLALERIITIISDLLNKSKQTKVLHSLLRFRIIIFHHFYALIIFFYFRFPI